MNHCYIFDYCNGSIFHCTIPDDVEDVESYICEKYNFSSSNIYTLTVPETLDIIDLDNELN